MRGTALVALGTVLALGGCAGGEDFGERPSEKRSRAAVEAEMLGQVRSVTDLTGSTLTDLRVETPACDIASPGRLWAMIVRGKLSVPRDQQAAALRAVRDQWDRENREFGDRRIAPDGSLPDGETGHLQAGFGSGNASVIGGAEQDHLDVIVSSSCYDAVKGENPARG
ncbi:hypothetical protein [Actinoplanes solisilvae]|uniref:hypothetical protein n=1 Tax=Actinoplanes solisilvae TaxID=2486853 RepID=UPI000FD6F53D|nr:hypothetical protein [Actinoplanes solisilvae]